MNIFVNVVGKRFVIYIKRWYLILFKLEFHYLFKFSENVLQLFEIFFLFS